MWALVVCLRASGLGHGRVSPIGADDDRRALDNGPAVAAAAPDTDDAPGIELEFVDREALPDLGSGLGGYDTAPS